VPSFIRHPKDFWTGIIFLVVGLAAIIIGRDYSMGTAARMGPAYFPTILGGILALIGLAALVRSLFRQGEAVGQFAIRELIIILSAVLSFGFLVRGAGLVVAAVVLVMLSCYASPKFRWGPSLLLAIGLTVFCVLVFVKLLGVPLPVFGSWFGA
jgi:hypothetical protein